MEAKAPAKKRKTNRGRHEFEPTERQRMEVEILAACGFAQKHIATRIKNPHTGDSIDIKTLKRYFAEELEQGLSSANAVVANRLFKIATTGSERASVTASCFWLARRAGWKETTAHEHAGKDGAPLPIAPALPLSEAQFDELRRHIDDKV